MKSFLAYILLFSLVLRPAYNIGYVAYFQLNIDYIIETYCVNKEKPELQCNGKCHLASQLTVNPIENTEDNSYLGSIFEAFVPVYLHKNKSHFILEQPIALVKHNWNYNNMFSTPVRDILIPPPQA
ncbi:hypothetical protein [Flavivirga eckloniae]|uniref:Uncharacterized protein n=1 Tax=Flavivirga eckloniae TaxID=1803846 RepID=A0A2K9PQZ2_9FLAO|nr:hypothetical protein [Flavivirga eckloniae]AUP79482.1 hypothetical protein C1H87_12500 [Flavivirga eckloniae]